MKKNIILLVIVFILLIIPKISHAQGMGVFIETSGNCNLISNPVSNATWCLIPGPPPQLYMYNGSSYTLSGANGPTGLVPISSGQANAQVLATQLPYRVISSAVIQLSGSSVTIPVPSGAVVGTDAFMATIAYQGGSGLGTPSGWTLVRNDCSTVNCQSSYVHVVTNSEPSNYVWTFTSAPAVANGAITIFRNVNQTTPIDKSTGIGTASTTLTLSALAPTNTGELAYLAIASGAPISITGQITNLTALWQDANTGNWGSFVWTYPVFNAAGTTVTASYISAGGTTYAATEIYLNGLSGSNNNIITNNSDSNVQSLVGESSNDSIYGFNLDGNINVVAYGADPTGGTDSSQAIQNAVNAACTLTFNLTNTVVSPVVFFPKGLYKVYKPIIVASTCGGLLELKGQGKGATYVFMDTNYSKGPIFVVEPGNAISSLNSGTITNTALVGSGRSLYWASSSVPFDLDLNQLMKFQPAILNGLSALDVRFWAKTHSASTEPSGDGNTHFISSDGQLNDNCTTITCSGAFTVYADANGAVHYNVNLNGTVVPVVSANGVWTYDIAHEVEAVWDGSAVCIFVDGSRVANSTGHTSVTVTQRNDEDFTLGYTPLTYPMQSPTGRIWYSAPAQMDSVEIRKATTAGRTCTNISYTKDTQKFGGDGNSVLLLNFDNMYDISNNNTTTSPALIGADYFNGTAYASRTTARSGAWISVRNEGLTSGTGVAIHDMTITGGGNNIYEMSTQDSYVFDTNLSAYYAALFVSNSNYNFSSYGIDFGTTSFTSAIITGGSGIDDIRDWDIGTSGCTWACMIMGGAGGLYHKIYMAPISTTVWGLAINNLNNSPAVYDFTDSSFDVENGGSSGAVFIEGPGVFSFNRSGITSAGANTPAMTIGPAATTITSTKVALHDNIIGIGNSAPEVINNIATFGSGAQLSISTNGNIFASTGLSVPPNSIPWSNTPTVMSINPDQFGITTINGSLTGTASCRETATPFTVVCTFSNYVSTPNTYTYPVPFNSNATITQPLGNGAQAFLNSLLLPQGGPITGTLIVSGN